MKKNDIHYQTFKKGSKTYFNSSLFFPKHIREDVFKLYGFVRVADDFVDEQPQDKEGFYRFQDLYRKARDNGSTVGDPIIDGFVSLSKKAAFSDEWVDGFLHSMEMDLYKTTYNTIEETLEYIYGSAEVIGLFMARVMKLNDDSIPCAQLLGRSMQYINFIRDIEEDNELGRQYLPASETTLPDLHQGSAETEREEFFRFIGNQLDRYNAWQREAEKGFSFIPKRYRIPIQTASDMYKWTACRIEDDPFVVYRKKVKPSKRRIFFTIIKNLLF